MDSLFFSSKHTGLLEEMALERDSLPVGEQEDHPRHKMTIFWKSNFMLYVHKFVWEGCSLKLHWVIYFAFGWKFFLWSSFYWKSLLCKTLLWRLSPHQSGPECRLQFCLQSYCRAFSILISVGYPKRLVDNGDYTVLVKPAAVLSLKYPKMEVKVFFLPCLLFHLVQLLCESHSVKNILKGKADY